ncbi:MAG: glycosyltransferase WbuB [Rhodospirillales bacterium]|nr:glycosyltransferase WbuB [Rhodospirillales bacterium]
MRILVYGLNYLPELTGIGKYTGEMCEWLAGRGHELDVVCAVPYYPEWQVPQAFRTGLYRSERRNGVGVHRSRLFVPAKPTTATRLIHLASFAGASLPQLLCRRSGRPDVLIAVEPTMFCVPGALLAARLFGAKCLLHVQDFELDAMAGLGMGKSGRAAAAVERWLMRRFDAISTISYSMVERAREKMCGGGRVLFFPNWVDIDFVKPGPSGDSYRALWGISPETRVVLYSGNMGHKQGLEIVLDAAAALRGESDVVFLFVGAGSAVEMLRKKAEAMNLGNVRFYPLQPYENLPELMALADVHLVVQRRGAADAVLPSKLTTILAAGGDALITAEPHTELGKLCERHPGIGVCIEPEDSEALTRALREMVAAVDVGARRRNPVARMYAEQNLSKERVLERFEADLQQLIANGEQHG